MMREQPTVLRYVRSMKRAMVIFSFFAIPAIMVCAVFAFLGYIGFWIVTPVALVAYLALYGWYALRVSMGTVIGTEVTDTVVRDSDPALPVARRVEEEGKRILAALSPQDIVVCLDEKGRSMTSREFSRFLDGMSTDATRRPCFIVGGPFGLHDSVREKARHLIAFGPQTLPHELARVVLLEQLYRAETLLRNMPYHHD